MNEHEKSNHSQKYQYPTSIRGLTHGYKFLSFSIKVNGYFPCGLNMQCDFFLPIYGSIHKLIGSKNESTGKKNGLLLSLHIK